MKTKAFLWLCLSLAFSISQLSAQTLQKGNLIGTHIMTVKLNTGVTMDQFMQVYTSKVLPEMNKMDPNWKVYLVKSIRGANKDSFGQIHIIKSEKDRDKYYNQDGTNTELGIALNKKFEQVLSELNKYGTVTTVYNDWLVQQ